VFFSIKDIIFIIFISLMIGGIGLFRMLVFTKIRPKIMIFIAIIAALIFMIVNITIYITK
jgi:hypothetical protein